MKKLDYNNMLILLREQGVKISEDVKCNVLKYLNEGLIMAVSPGVSSDEYYKSKGKIPVSPCTMTDGVWIWSNIAIYYITTYDMSIPDGFIKHMQKNGWKIDQDSIKVKLGPQE